MGPDAMILVLIYSIQWEEMSIFLIQLIILKIKLNFSLYYSF